MSAVATSGRRRVTLALLGDVMIGGAISRELGARPAADFWADTLPVLRSADAAIANLECPVTTSERPWPGLKMWKFRARPESLEILRVAGIKAVNLANNHALDYDNRGLLETRERLEAAGIVPVGAGASLAEAAAPRLVEIGPLRVGLIGLTDTMREFAAGPDRPGTNHMRIDPRPETVAPVAAAVAALRRQGADLVVLSAHWGPNFRRRPPRAVRAFAHRLIEAGVDIIHGHSAHRLLGVERHGLGLILYDTGNMLDDYLPFPFCDTQSSAIFLVEIEEGRPCRLRLVPVRLGDRRTVLARGARFEHIQRRLEQDSRPLGTALRRTAEGLELTLAEPVGTDTAETPVPSPASPGG